MSKEKDIEFLQNLLVKRQKDYISLEGLSPDPSYDSYELPQTDPDDERAARILDSLDMKPNPFRSLIPCPDSTWYEWFADTQRNLGRQIEIIPRMIAELEKSDTGLNTTTTPPDVMDLTKSEQETTPKVEWSNPMTKAEIMSALGLPTYKTLAVFAKFHPIKQAGSNKLWQIQLDGLNKAQIEKLQKS